MASKFYVQPRRLARITSIVSFGVNLVFLIVVVYLLACSSLDSLRQLETSRQSQEQVHGTLEVNFIDYSTSLFFSPTLNLAIYTASSIPQLLGAGMVFIATGTNKSPKETSELLTGHTKMQVVSIGIDVAGLLFFLVGEMVVGDFVNAETTVILIIFGMMSLICILITDRFRKKLENQ